MLYWLVRHVELGRLQFKVACIEVPVWTASAGVFCMAGLSFVGIVASLIFLILAADLIAGAIEVHVALVEQEAALAAEAAAIVKARRRVKR